MNYDRSKLLELLKFIVPIKIDCDKLSDKKVRLLSVKMIANAFLPL